MYNKKKKKKKKKKIGLFDRLKEMGRNISSTLTAPQRRVAKEKMERRMETSGIKSQSGESRMRKGKLYETAPKGTRKTGEDNFAPPMSKEKQVVKIDLLRRVLVVKLKSLWKLKAILFLISKRHLHKQTL